MGWRNTTSTVLSFGEAGRGLAHMFQKMNEARIGIGLYAAFPALHEASVAEFADKSAFECFGQFDGAQQGKPIAHATHRETTEDRKGGLRP